MLARTPMVRYLIHSIILLLAGSGTAATAGEGPGATLPPRDLIFLNWSEYLDPALVESFEKQFHSKLRETYFASDSDRDTIMLQTDGKGYDLVMVNDTSVDLYRKRGWLAPLAEEKLPNLRYIDNRWRDAFGGARGYAVPYFWGNVGIVYRTDLVEATPRSWLDLYRPAEYLRGHIGMLGDMRDVVGLALKALGYSADSTAPKAVDAASALMLAQQPYVYGYESLGLGEDSAMLSGDVIMAMLYNGDAATLQEQGEHIGFVVPNEGSSLWVDYLAVPQASKNKDLAWEFVNFLNEPANAAQLAEYVNYATPNNAAKALLPEEFLNNPVIYPTKDILTRSEFVQPLPPRALKKRNSIFERVISQETHQ